MLWCRGGNRKECWLNLTKGGWAGGRDSFNSIEKFKLSILFYFLEDVDPTFKMFKNWYDSKKTQNHEKTFQKWLWFVFAYFESFGVSKVKNHGFRGSWKFPPIPKIINMKTFGIFGKWKLKVTSLIWSRIILHSFCSFQSLKSRIKMNLEPL